MSSPDLSAELRSFFQDPDASSAVILSAQNVAAPVVQGQALTPTELKMGGGIRVVQWLIDGSGSMFDIAAELRDNFTSQYEPAVRAAREDDISALRIGGIVFNNSGIKPIWESVGANGQPSYYHAIDKLPALTEKEYSPWGGTPLHKAIADGTARALRYAAEQQMATGMDVDVDIIILTDGANTDAPYDPSDARQLIRNRDRTRVRYVFFYMETDGGLHDPKAYAIHKLGIDSEQVEAFLAKPGESLEDLRRRFRQMMQVASRVSASKNVSAVVASAAFDDEEIV